MLKTRSRILTSRNHHSDAQACITEDSIGFSESNGQIPFENGFLSEILQQNGYNTYCLGKWHRTPAEQISPAGPYDRWPRGWGFERYYGFLGGETHQYFPELIYNNHQTEAPTAPEEGDTLNEDLANRAISFIADARQIAPTKPFFMDKDPTQAKNLAEMERGRLIELIALWYAEVGRYNVRPIDSRGQQPFGLDHRQIAADRKHYIYLPDPRLFSGNVAPQLIKRPFTIRALVIRTNPPKLCRYTRGRHGFDVGRETSRCMPRCRVPRKTICKTLVANDDNYALAA